MATSKEYLAVDDKEMLTQLVEAMYPELPAPKRPKKIVGRDQ